MMYKQPDIRYVDMAIWIDANNYREDLTDADNEQIFIYLYHLFSMLAHKARYFKKKQYYEDFCIYAATQVFLRLKNKKQFQLDENGNPKLKKVKSVLNFIKKTIYPMKVDFQQQFYSQEYKDIFEEKEEVFYDTEYSFSDRLSDQVDSLSLIDFNSCLGDIIKTVQFFLKDIPYKQDSVTWKNIYMSCLLSFLNSITLKNKDLIRIQTLKRGVDNRDGYIEELYMQENKDSTILYHLPESMKDYITILTREMKRVIAKDLSSCLHTYIPSNSGMRMLINAELRGPSEEGWYEE